MLGVGQRVGGVGVHLQRHVAESLPHSAHGLNVPARLDLQLDPPVALVQVSADGLQKLSERRLDADRDAAIHRAPDGAEKSSERLALGAQLCVEDRHLDRRLRHLMSVDRMQQRRHVRGNQLSVEQPGNQVVDQDVAGGVDVLR